MTDHARELAMRAGLRGPTRVDIPFMIEAATKTAWATDKGMTIATGVVTALREAAHLRHRLAAQAKLAGRLPTAVALDKHVPPDRCVILHDEHPGRPAKGRLYHWPDFTPPRSAWRRRSCGLVCHRPTHLTRQH